MQRKRKVWNEAMLEFQDQLHSVCNDGRLGFDEVIGEHGKKIREEEEDFKAVLRSKLIQRDI